MTPRLVTYMFSRKDQPVMASRLQYLNATGAT